LRERMASLSVALITGQQERSDGCVVGDEPVGHSNALQRKGGSAMGRGVKKSVLPPKGFPPGEKGAAERSHN